MPLLKPADLLLPREIPLERWCVVACDQYTSQPQYWDQVRERVGAAPSTYHMVYPECYLKGTDPAVYTEKINQTMLRYLEEGVFRRVGERYILVKRTLRDGRCRWGLMAAVDLEAYDYHPGSRSAIRATEGTVAQRLPPRMQVRRGAALELTHIMLLMDDPADTVLGPLKAAVDANDQGLAPQYRGELMADSGHLEGWSVGDSLAEQLEQAIQGLPGVDGMVFAVGDGNHSLATAKGCFEELKQSLPPKEWQNHPARYALVEIVNLYDASLAFEPIHRLVQKVNSTHLLGQLQEAFSKEPVAGGQQMGVVTPEGSFPLWTQPDTPLAVGVLQSFLDGYLARYGGEVDYIHGEDVLESLAQGPDRVGFLLPPMDKARLFPSVVADGVLPRKTFSMGHAQDKRFYLECRAIK